MKDQLIQYVSLLFAGAGDCEDVKQEILQNTLDRYDDLIAEGKSPDAAYRLAITGIGDINEILGNHQPSPAPVFQNNAAEETDTPVKKLLRAVAIALYIICPIPLIVLSEMGMDTIGLCGLLTLVAIATVFIILGSKKGSSTQQQFHQTAQTAQTSQETELHKSVGSLIWIVALALYLLLSFTTNAWHITWVLFPLAGAVQRLVVSILSGSRDLKKGITGILWAVGLAVYFLFSFATGAWFLSWLIFPLTGACCGLAKAILDLKEANRYEN